MVESFLSNDFDQTLSYSDKSFVDELLDILETSFSLFGRNKWFILKFMVTNDKSIIFGKYLSPSEKSLVNRINKLKNHIESYILSRIEQSKNLGSSSDPNKRDFLEVFIKKHLEGHCSLEEIVHQFFTFYFAGTDTTGNLSGMIFYCLGKYPHLQEKLHELISSKSGWENFEFQDLKIPELEHFINEVLRLYPPVPILVYRESITAHKIKDYELENRDLAIVCPISQFYNPKYFESPFDFKPERWVNYKPIESL